MTVDGSYVLGASVYASSVSLFAIHPLIATILAIFAGMLAGSFTAILHTHLKMMNLLAGIVVMTALYSINLRIMGKPNVALIHDASLFDMVPWGSKSITLFLIIAAVYGALVAFLKTDIGLALRSCGSNDRMSRAQGIDDKKMILLGLSLSNGMVALSGALYAQWSGFSDINLGVGTVITGLAALIIGEAIFSSRHVFKMILGCILGSIIFYGVTSFALNFSDFGFQTSDQKLLTALFMILTMRLSALKNYFKKE